MSELVLIFEGTDTEAGILKNLLEGANIPSLLKSAVNSAAIAGFGSVGSCAVYISPGDTDKAAEIVNQFKTRHSA